MPEVVCSTDLNCSVATLREYLGKSINLKEITDPEMNLKIVSADDVIQEGSEIEFQVSTYGIKQTMKHRYTEVTDTLIQSEQLEGPTRSWVHQVIMESTGDNTCKLTDQIEFEPPGGMMGFVMTEAKIRESITEGMECRYESLGEILGAGK
ncbi:MAG: hypothetical protein ABJZ55_12750 [Fuerstiella sp.]